MNYDQELLKLSERVWEIQDLNYVYGMPILDADELTRILSEVHSNHPTVEARSALDDAAAKIFEALHKNLQWTDDHERGLRHYLNVQEKELSSERRFTRYGAFALKAVRDDIKESRDGVGYLLSKSSRNQLITGMRVDVSQNLLITSDILDETLKLRAQIGFLNVALMLSLALLIPTIALLTYLFVK